MRTKHTFRTARHYERDPLLHAVRWQIDIRRQGGAERGNGVFPREIVDPAIAFGFAQYRDDRLWIDLALLDQAQQAGDITGAFGGNANDVDRCYAHALPPGHLRAGEKIWQAVTAAGASN